MYQIRMLPQDIVIDADSGEDLLEIQIRAGLRPDAPCGGQGTCGKCLVEILNGADDQKFNAADPQLSDDTDVIVSRNDDSITVKACRYHVHGNLTIRVPEQKEFHILESGIRRTFSLNPRIREGYGAAFDIGTTSVVCYLLDLGSGRQLGRASMLNPQSQYGADVISRCEYAMENGVGILASVIRQALNELISRVCRDNEVVRKGGCVLPEEIQLVTVVGNTCMHHLFLKIDPRPLTVVPYEAAVKDEIVMNASEADIIVHPDASLQILPNIAGFVGADTVGCLLASAFDELDDLTLMIDIGTNGEMVMGNRNRMIACSTAAGPAFEGARIECGMRGMAGAIDHVKYMDGRLVCHVLQDLSDSDNPAVRPEASGQKNDDRSGTAANTDTAVGICGSGLMDAVAAALDAGIIDETGKIDPEAECVFIQPGTNLPAIRLTEQVYLSQKDIREVQLAKGAVAAGIELLAAELGIKLTDIRKILIAGAFGNYMDPHSACRIGMIPMELEGCIEMIGNAAGEGSIIATLSVQEFLHAQEYREKTEFLELASSPDFQDTFVDNLLFE